MKLAELAEIFLDNLHDIAEREGHGKSYSLDEIAAKLGEHDRGKVMEIARFLESSGLVNASITNKGTSAGITGAGSLLVEKGGETGIIKKYREGGDQMAFSEPSDRVFVVHGHDVEMKQSVARTLETLGLQPVILHEQPNKGRTIVEKFVDYADVRFAVVLLSPDDMAYPKGTQTKQIAKTARSRARQNVILELGYFLGKLGRERVVALYKKDDRFELPSDYQGVIFLEYDSLGHWRYQLAGELQAAGYKDADKNKLK